MSGRFQTAVHITDPSSPISEFTLRMRASLVNAATDKFSEEGLFDDIQTDKSVSWHAQLSPITAKLDIFRGCSVATNQNQVVHPRMIKIRT